MESSLTADGKLTCLTCAFYHRAGKSTDTFQLRVVLEILVQDSQPSSEQRRGCGTLLVVQQPASNRLKDRYRNGFSWWFIEKSETKGITQVIALNGGDRKAS